MDVVSSLLCVATNDLPTVANTVRNPLFITTEWLNSTASAVVVR
jgi:hypothetical protein